MQSFEDKVERRTTTDLVFDRLFDAIVSLELLPGTKLSEAEVAKRFGVSRQPVRDAFNKLEAQELLLIRPQKATQVRGFSLERISQARFVRLAVELEIVRSACAIWRPEHSEALHQNLVQQREIAVQSQPEEFHRLDYEFHKLICTSAGHSLVFETIGQNKRKVDRLCMLSLERQSEAETLVKDHEEIASALDAKDADRAAEVMRRHLGRLDATIESIYAKHAEYFE